MLKLKFDLFFVTSFLCSLEFLLFYLIGYLKRCPRKKKEICPLLIFLDIMVPCKANVPSLWPWPLICEGHDFNLESVCPHKCLVQISGRYLHYWLSNKMFKFSKSPISHHCAIRFHGNKKTLDRFLQNLLHGIPHWTSIHCIFFRILDIVLCILLEIEN